MAKKSRERYIKEHGGSSATFNLVDEATVKRLAKDGKVKVPSKTINVPKDKRWNEKYIGSQILQGIEKGEPVGAISNRIFPEIYEKAGRQTEPNLVKKCIDSAVRNARTMTTSAENNGRLDSYKSLADQGVVQKKVWVATPDDRTREEHLLMDGEEVDIDEEFSNGLMFPADGSGAPEEVWNCRCTMRDHIVGFTNENGDIVYIEGERDKTQHGEQVEAEKFVRALDEAKSSCPPDKAWRVDSSRTSKDFVEENIKLHITEGGSTFALKEDGDIISVCKNQITDSETNARSILASAVEAGGTHLDSFDGNYGFYVRCGFEPVSRCKFDVDYAPDGWRAGRDKQEDIFFMRYVGVGNVKNSTLEEARKNIPYAKGYDEAEKIIKKIIGSAR